MAAQPPLVQDSATPPERLYTWRPMGVYQARKGETKEIVIVQEVLALWWTRARGRPGEKVKLGAILKDVKDGKKITFEVRYQREVLKSLEATLSGGKAEVDWTIDVRPGGSGLPERSWPDEVILEASCCVDGKIRERPSQRPELHVDLGLPKFSV